MQDSYSEYKLLHFIDETVEVHFEGEPLFEKTPVCPKAFIWRDKKYLILEEISAWQDFKRRGRLSRNMQPAHAERAVQKGSWGVGRFNFRIRSDGDRFFDLYYDRAPQTAGDRKGRWILLVELQELNG